jgi:pimeloyl-ACP methyl ester carboxylesterase
LSRTKIVTGVLILSLGLNVCALVMTVTFFKLRASYKQLEKQLQAIRQKEKVNGVSAPLETIGSMRVSRRSFASQLDGQEDFYAVLPPSISGRLDYILIVYLHGMGSNYLEPFVYPEPTSVATSFANRWANVCVLSCNYRQQASWGSDAAMADISQNIREIEQQYPIKQIVIAGTSMGGCTALAYAVQAPDDIKEKIVGVLSVEGAGDLAKLYLTTRNPQVQAALQSAMGGTPATAPTEYARKSFIPNVDKLGKNVRVAVVSATQDVIVPTPLQQDIVQALQNAHHPVHVIKVDSGHQAPPGEVYVKAAEFILQPQ